MVKLNIQSKTQWYRISQWKSRILTKLGPDGLCNTQSHHNTKWPPNNTPGGHQGALNVFLHLDATKTAESNFMKQNKATLTLHKLSLKGYKSFF